MLPNHARWNIGCLDAQEWLHRLTFDDNCVEQLYSVQPLPSCATISINVLFKLKASPQSYLNISFTLALGLQTKVLASISSKWDQRLLWAFLVEMILLWLQMIPLNKGCFYETHAAYRMALIYSTCSSNRQSEIKVTQENAPTKLPRLQERYFTRFPNHYVMQKNSGCIKIEQRYLCRVL